ncbi:MAG TPA: MarR family winged helix-turn-helix transcriptional regulator [Actinomycetota bacterium]|nr:MarR family winged helix-turn-helix transcriptional regulator [Actinomycetota bacterium]
MPPAAAAFLLSQLGAHAAALFAQRVAQLDLTPEQAGLLRLVALQPGRSQQALADQLGVAPSKIVSLVDGLEARGFLERRRSTSDRRYYALHLTDRGTQVLAEIREVGLQHENELTAALDGAERLKLIELLQRIADQQGLEPGVHPGYRSLSVDAPRPRN